MKWHSMLIPCRVALVLAALALPQMSMAQLDPWQRIQLAQIGHRIEVENRAGRRMAGTLESWSAAGLPTTPSRSGSPAR